VNGPIKLVVWEPLPADHPARGMQRVAMLRIKPDGAVVRFDGRRRTVARVTRLQPGESVWRLIERAAALMARSDEIGG
jgi:hypothetical protein